MAVVVSHAMRRYPTSPPGSSYSSHCLGGEGSYEDPWPRDELSKSSLSRSMRYAEPWLYGSVRAPGGLLLAPAFVLCSCSEYLTGTKRSSKKGPSVCKKCKGTRFPWPSTDTLRGTSKFGTVRCYPTTPTVATSPPPIRPGTVRVNSHSRPSILPSADPYELMRRSRLSPENGTQFRIPSKSDGTLSKRSQKSTKKSIQDSEVFTPSKNHLEADSIGNGRKSILECDINPYDLMESEEAKKDPGVTMVGGQRVRIRPPSEQVYEDLQPPRQPSQIPKLKSPANRAKEPPKSNEKESDANRFKSILKKPTTFSDTDSAGPERSPSPAHKSGSHFYLPMPMSTPRKKVQFLVEPDEQNGPQDDTKEAAKNARVVEREEPSQLEDANIYEEVIEYVETAEKSSSLRRSVSERLLQESTKVVFHDTMALRTRSRRDSRKAFHDEHVKKPGKSVRARSNSPPPPRSRRSPPPKTMKEVMKTNQDLIENEEEDAIYEDPPPFRENDSKPDPQPKSEPQSKFNLLPKSDPQAKSNSLPKPDPQPKSLPKLEIHPQFDLLPNTELNTNFNKEAKSNMESKSNSQLASSDIKQSTQRSKELSSVDHHTQETTREIKLVASPEPEPRVVLKIDTPPAAPPRKRSNNKQPPVVNIDTSKAGVQKLKIESPVTSPSFSIPSTPPDYQNKTIVQIRSPPTVHKIQIRNEFLESNNIQTVTIGDNTQRKTSIMINGDDCYSTINVNDDVPLYQSSVVVNDSGSGDYSNRRSSSVYITGNFVNTSLESPTIQQNDKQFVVNKSSPPESPPVAEAKDQGGKECREDKEPPKVPKTEEDLKHLLKDPVEAVKRNLVPHVCGRSDVSRRPRDKKLNNFTDSLLEDRVETNITKLIEDSLLKLRNYEAIGDDDRDVYSEHSSTQYETMDPGSDCYTDNSNRSSVTEEELNARTKFYEMLADSAIAELSESEDHHYESIRLNSDPIYEEITPPPLPSNPPPSSILDDLQLDKQFTTRSIFEGASKYDILSYLVDAKERGIVPEDSYNFGNTDVVIEEEAKEVSESYRVSHTSSVSDSSEESSLVITNGLADDKGFQKSAEVERNDSGVGSETSKSSLIRFRSKSEASLNCEDCETVLESTEENEPLICRKCLKKRSERKEIITEIVETEEKYSRDLQIILEEFYQPMLVAGLLTPDQLSAIFLNVEELLENSQALAERLRDAVEIAIEQGDEDLLTVNIGKLFLEAAPMLHAFETYCIRQGPASLLLASLEKEKELLRIFLRVSQMENTMLRRMNLNSFLMVPVQRVTKYPLLLTRLYKATPVHHETRDQLKEAQHKIELHLNHMNSETKDVPSKLWRRIGSSSGRRSSSEMDLVSIKLRKIAVDVLEWNHDEAKFALEGKLLFTQPTDNNWRKGRTIKLAPINALLVTNGKQPIGNRTEEDALCFPKKEVREAALLLVRDKNGRYSLLREPLYLDRCIIATDPAWQSYFEVQEVIGKDTFIFKAEDDEMTRKWYKQLQHHAQGLGGWRKRRNALANIMINGMGLRS